MRPAPFWLVHRIEECAERSARRHDTASSGPEAFRESTMRLVLGKRQEAWGSKPPDERAPLAGRRMQLVNVAEIVHGDRARAGVRDATLIPE